MMGLKTGLLMGSVLMLLLGGAPADAQSAPPATDSLFRAGVAEGSTTARTIGTTVWTWSGFAGGLTLGPLGVGLAYAIAGSSASPLPADLQSKVGRKGSEFALAYQQAYTEKLVARRKRASLVGGATGTAMLVAGTVGMYLRLR